MSLQSECTFCSKNPNAHSFVHLGSNDDVHYVYTSPARAQEYRESEENIQNFKKHFDSMKGKRWVWIFDCANMQLKHLSSFEYTRKLATILTEGHPHTLLAIHIIHPNVWMKTTVKLLQKLFSNTFCKKLRILEGSKLELYMAFEKASIRGEPLVGIVQAINAPQ